MKQRDTTAGRRVDALSERTYFSRHRCMGLIRHGITARNCWMFRGKSPEYAADVLPGRRKTRE